MIERTASGDVLVLAVPLDDVDATLSWLLRLEIAIAGAVTVIVVAATGLIVRRGLRPLERNRARFPAFSQESPRIAGGRGLIVRAVR